MTNIRKSITFECTELQSKELYKIMFDSLQKVVKFISKNETEVETLKQEITNSLSYTYHLSNNTFTISILKTANLLFASQFLLSQGALLQRQGFHLINAN